MTHWRNSQISLSVEKKKKEKIVSIHLIYQYIQNANQKKAALWKKNTMKESLSLLADSHDKEEYFLKSQIFTSTVNKTVAYIALAQKGRCEL